MRRSTFRLSRPLQAAVYVSFGALLLTGVGWMLAQDYLDEEAWEKVPRWLLKIHGGAAMAALLVLGALTLHVKRGWKAGRNRLSGALLIALNGFLVATGYGLYYAGGEEMRAWLSRWHAWVGIGTLVLLPAHVIVGRLIIRRLHRQKSAGEPVSRASPPRRHLP